MCGVSCWTCWREILGDRVALFSVVVNLLLCHNGSSFLRFHLVDISDQLHTCNMCGYYEHEFIHVGSVVITSHPEGVARYCFHPVCLSVCPANILVFYFSAIGRDIDLKFIQDTYRLYSLHWTKIDLHRWKVKVTGTVHYFLKVVM